MKIQPSSSDTVQLVRDRKGPSPYSRLCALTKARHWIAWALLKLQHSYWILCTSIVIKVLHVHPFSAEMVYVQDFAFSFVPFQYQGTCSRMKKEHFEPFCFSSFSLPLEIITTKPHYNFKIQGFAGFGKPGSDLDVNASTKLGSAWILAELFIFL